ncbi:hypothetical protein KSP39_PZI020314 [Platanthera zijinensis]|uniref:CCHC-type domain-containing protein n=1 Tax=Platanthera zijinensis TaxID=2320716 RepID=A0AAP0AZB9_9ASPA
MASQRRNGNDAGRDAGKENGMAGLEEEKAHLSCVILILKLRERGEQGKEEEGKVGCRWCCGGPNRKPSSALRRLDHCGAFQLCAFRHGAKTSFKVDACGLVPQEVLEEVQEIVRVGFNSCGRECHVVQMVLVQAGLSGLKPKLRCYPRRPCFVYSCSCVAGLRADVEKSRLHLLETTALIFSIQSVDLHPAKDLRSDRRSLIFTGVVEEIFSQFCERCEASLTTIPVWVKENNISPYIPSDLDEVWKINDLITRYVAEEEKLKKEKTNTDLLVVKPSFKKKKKFKAPFKAHDRQVSVSKETAGKKPLSCFFCKKKGHMKHECLKFKSWMEKRGFAPKDDILLANSDLALLHKSKQFLSKHFDMKDLVEASFVLGIEIIRDRSPHTLALVGYIGKCVSYLEKPHLTQWSLTKDWDIKICAIREVVRLADTPPPTLFGKLLSYEMQLTARKEEEKSSRSEYKDKSVAFKDEVTRKGRRKSPSPPRRSVEAEVENPDISTSDSHNFDEDFAVFTRQFQRFMKKKKWRTKPSSSFLKDDYYKKKKTSKKDRYSSNPSKQITSKIVCYCCNRPGHFIADCPDQRKETKDKKKPQNKGKKEKSFVAQKQKSGTDSSSSESGEEDDAEAYIGLFTIEEDSMESEFLHMLDSINGGEDYYCRGLMALSEEDQCQDQPGPSKALKRSKFLVKKQTEEIESLKLAASDSAKMLDLKLNEAVKLKNITVIQMGTISFKENHIRNLEARLQKEKDLVTKFSKPKSVLPLIDNFISQKGKTGLGFKERTRAVNYQGKGKDPVQPLAMKPPISFRKVMQPTNRYDHDLTHGHCEYGDLNGKGAYANRPPYKQTHQVLKEFLGYAALAPILKRNTGNNVVKPILKKNTSGSSKGLKERMDKLTISEDQPARLDEEKDGYCPGGVQDSLDEDNDNEVHQNEEREEDQEVDRFSPARRHLKDHPAHQIISDSKFTKEFIKKYGMESASTMKTPMGTSMLIGKDEAGKHIDESLYRGIIGSLLYLTACRPDIMYAIYVYARYQACPKESHYTAVK